jgi:glycosyltransferase involved in cell wall biosynthesis
MNICMLTDKFLPSQKPTGVGVAAYGMALALTKRGSSVHYICRGETDGTTAVNDRLAVQTIKHFSKDNLGASLKILKEGRCDIFHVHSSAAAPSLLAARALRKPTVFHSHGDQPLHPLGLTLIRSVEMGLSQRVITVSENTRQDIIRNHHVPSDKVVVAYNGVDPEEFSPSGDRSSILGRYNLEGYEKIVLSVGAIQPRKGQLTMVGCLPEILKAWPRLAYVNVGTEYDEAFKSRILERASDLGVSRAVRLLPSVPREDLVALVNAADLCVHPSVREPFGLAVVEEMACGKAVLAFNVDAMPEIIDDRVDGILVEPNRSEDLTKTILQALGDPGLTRRLGDAARLKVAAKFTWDRTAAQLEEIYHRVGQ